MGGPEPVNTIILKTRQTPNPLSNFVPPNTKSWILPWYLSKLWTLQNYGIKLQIELLLYYQVFSSPVLLRSKFVRCPSLLLSLSSLLSQTFHIFIFFSRTTRPISTKLGTKHYWVKRITVCLNEGSRRNNYEIAKVHLTINKKNSPETLGQFQPNLA